VAATLLDWLWTVGRARHTGETAQFVVPISPFPQDIIRGHEPEWGTVSRPIAALPLTGDAAEEVLRRLLASEADAHPSTEEL
jgi:hypothetical protein